MLNHFKIEQTWNKCHTHALRWDFVRILRKDSLSWLIIFVIESPP
jgi:hypothetical protein